tara:strand:+ start:75 stop:1118 length:1044 start_codon:yes stop_codon:yes gene_type:complete
MTNVSIKNLTKIYQGSTAPSLKNLSLEINSGTLTSILGPSGCGKTTTLKIIAGLIDHTSGDIAFDGKSVLKVKPEKRGAVMVFQNHLLFPYMNIHENIGFGLRMRNLNKTEINKKIFEMLELVQLPNIENRMPKELSGGEQQRVALARALIVQPKVLLLDEPLSNLDNHLRIEMRNLITDLQKKFEITTIFVTHDQEEAVEISDQIAFVLNGKLEQFDKPENFFKRPTNMKTARFFGCNNFINGTLKNNKFISSIGEFYLARDLPSNDGFLIFRPENIQIGKEDKNINTLKVKVVEKKFLGKQTRLKLAINDEIFEATFNPNEVKNLIEGNDIYVNIPPSCLWAIKN